MGTLMRFRDYALENNRRCEKDLFSHRICSKHEVALCIEEVVCLGFVEFPRYDPTTEAKEIVESFDNSFEIESESPLEGVLLQSGHSVESVRQIFCPRCEKGRPSLHTPEDVSEFFSEPHDDFVIVDPMGNLLFSSVSL